MTRPVDSPRHCSPQSGKRGPILVYNQGFEGRIVNELALRYKDLAEALAAVAERFVDLLPITRENYYHPAMKGSWSIKAVLANHCRGAGLRWTRRGSGRRGSTDGICRGHRARHDD